MEHIWKEILDSAVHWHMDTFKECTFESQLVKLEEELNELKDDMKVSDKQLFGYLKFRDMVICMRHIAEAVRYTAAKAGTRGGSIVVGGELTDGSYDGFITVTYEKDGK